jgi:hypothetical protein
MPGAHFGGGTHLSFIWAAALACCVVGAIFLYKAVTCEGFREAGAGKGKTRTSPIWEGRIISAFLGLMGVGVGIFIIVRILAGRQ